MAAEQLSTRCCVVGGGPCGIMLGFLLARAGIDVVVLEKHADFLRDFRGDTIHPSTLDVMAELGLLDDFLKLPHQKAPNIGAVFDGHQYPFADFRYLPTRCKFIALMPQWDFLNFLADRGKSYPSFHLRLRAEAVDLIEDGNRITGVRVDTPDGALEIRADLTVGCDGRHSTVRERAGFAFVIRKGAIEETKRAGLPAFRRSIARLAPVFASRVDELKDWDQIKLLTVAVNRLRRWYRPGLLCIGDAAHAMSPIGGVGVNLAVQDAVAAANLLWQPLKRGTLREDDLEAVQRRREFPTRVTQRLQVIVQNNVIDRALGAGQSLPAPWLLRLFSRFPPLRAIPAWLVGRGVRPEHVHTPEAPAGAG